MTGPVTSQIANVMDALVDICKETLDCPVYDGPIPTADYAKAFVVIGASDIDENADWIAATANQEWAGLGARSRKEEGDVFGVAVSWTGNSGDARPARTTGMGYIALIEQALRAKPQLGLQPAVNWAGISITQVRQISDKTGVGVWISFTVKYRAQLSGS